jgi:predicted ester cyclase
MPSGEDLVRSWVAMFNTGDGSGADQIAADDYVEHAQAPFGRSEPGPVRGPEHLRSAAAWLLEQFPDLRMTIDLLVADGDLVAALVTSTGTNLGPLDGVMPPTGRLFSARQSHWFRVRDGRLVEHWATRDDLDAMLQLGVLERPGRR